jgi:hypothetical protein
MDPRAEPMPDDARGGSFRELAGGRGVWAVRSREGWFRCNLITGWCECADFLVQKRRGQPLTHCRHLRALSVHLARQREMVDEAIHNKINGGMQASCEQRMGGLPADSSLTDAELRDLFR